MYKTSLKLLFQVIFLTISVVQHIIKKTWFLYIKKFSKENKTPFGHVSKNHVILDKSILTCLL
jgi:hypothetical protein